ncbi:hypothetical protein RhiirA5_360192 [Rhizophagus irregularis]|uniref:Uncharacterized protein n=3 Tax=Rhizophagus irregularis TaxID=588596 RepID=U9STC9_RHIID|nr:hypothetical protein GLOIN_2v1648665 [Rhizophagus irregularis DAOM 181602=DAOM 197198]EXX61189.1 hypothetical protein RirG_173460 [Rhizophagus irregularis DAOM 197198w]PKC06489.1 hypothetical protein RhiirA5_360192 [Rhizophagus irregularis]PKC56842.1 hypothetical protein RhiirA1_428878 [Rhizophagus irregularis]PKK56563.1 hypothetical protein RhiirC2_764325 [Rhizophagus irregularis]PKY26864.1 hypothetical protein RhiirB3_415587 [Rhizophagus irregularis]|eukprot:XP_025174171.1 hypothetical protein GLOIN_2v1648665 [Rhizophagus irregularis DAOM 181602=DAOM 197198]
MSSRNYGSRTGRAPYVQKIKLCNNNNKITTRKPTKLCSKCREAKDCVSLFSSKVNRIEEIVNNCHKHSKKKIEQISKFNTKFSLNNVPCELEYDLSNFTLENLQKLAIFTTQNCGNNNSYNDKDKHPY